MWPSWAAAAAVRGAGHMAALPRADDTSPLTGEHASSRFGWSQEESQPRHPWSMPSVVVMVELWVSHSMMVVGLMIVIYTSVIETAVWSTDFDDGPLEWAVEAYRSFGLTLSGLSSWGYMNIWSVKKQNVSVCGHEFFCSEQAFEKSRTGLLVVLAFITLALFVFSVMCFVAAETVLAAVEGGVVIMTESNEPTTGDKELSCLLTAFRVIRCDNLRHDFDRSIGADPTHPCYHAEYSVDGTPAQSLSASTPATTLDEALSCNAANTGVIQWSSVVDDVRDNSVPRWGMLSFLLFVVVGVRLACVALLRKHRRDPRWQWEAFGRRLYGGDSTGAEMQGLTGPTRECAGEGDVGGELAVKAGAV